MKLQDKLQMIRKNNCYSQEQLADKIGVSRQTVGNWETGQSIPELSGLIALSDLYGVPIDRMIRDDDDCNILLINKGDININAAIDFLLRAKKKTYAGHGSETIPSRIASHDLTYQEDNFLYYDTYLGGECFSGEEAVWINETPVWSMNYVGRIIGENYSGDFLKEVLSNVPLEMPYRGPAIYKKGDYCYHCKVSGEFAWYQGYEDIFYCDERIYECYFHGGVIK